MVIELQASAPIPILKSKLVPPRVSGPYVTRTRLEARLDRALAIPLTIVEAPAGHGKTRSLAEWLSARGHPAVWLTLSSADRNVMRFAAYVAAALDRAVPGLDRELDALLAAPDRLAPRELGEAFGDALFDLTHDLVLILDDYHAADDPVVATFLEGLIAAAPARLHTILSSRRKPSLTLARLRTLGRVNELTAEDFRFSAVDTASLLRAVTSREIDDEVAARLHHAVGGWPVAVRLLAVGVSAGGVPGTADTVPAEHGTQLLLDYLSEEVLSELTPIQHDLLLRASLPERFNADLLAVLADASGPGDIQRLELDRLRRLDLYREIPGIDETWFAYHALLREAFRRRLQRVHGAEAVADLHRRCARWFDRQGFTREAVAHLVEAGDITAASALIEARIQAAFAVEDWQSIDACLGLIPESEIERRPELIVASAWVAYLSGRGGRLLARLAQLRELRTRNLLDATQSAEVDLLDVVTVILSNPHPAETLLAAERASGSIHGSHRYQRGVAQMFLALALGAVGRVEDGLDRLAAFSEHESSRIDAASIRGFFGRILVLWQAGRIAAVEQTAADMLELAHRHRLPVSIGWGHYFLGLAAHERGEIEAASRHFATIIATADQVHFLCIREAFHRQILIYLGQGRLDEADRALSRLRELVLSLEAPEHLTTCDSLAARLALFRGDLPSARRWLSSSGADAGALEFVRTENPIITRAMALIAENTPESRRSAQGLLDEIGRRARASHSRIGVIDVLALTAALRAANGDESGAIAALRESLALGAEERIVMRYTFLPVPLAPLLRRLLRDPAPPPHAREVLALLEAATAAQVRVSQQPPAGAHAALPEPLTTREFEVLGCLERRLTNDEIGQELFISPITARNHVRNICSKLGVSGRRTAIARAQELGLLG